MDSLSFLVLYLCFHACFARPLMVSTKDEMTKHHHTNMVQLANQGKKVRTFFQQATGAEVQTTWKRGDRSTLQKSSEKVEEIDVMDYAQPHRKPPIHNINSGT